MTNEIRQHIERSKQFIKVAEDLSKLKYWDNVISRTYYAMFHAATAVLLNINIQRSSHHALIAAFGEHIAKMNLMDTKFHRYLLDAFSARSESDYFPVSKASKEEALSMIKKAKEFLSTAKEYLNLK